MAIHQLLPSDLPCVWSARGVRGDVPDGPLAQGLDLDLPAGLTAIIGGEGRGKTLLLKLLCGDAALGPSQASAFYLDLRLPADDALTPEQVWQRLRPQAPRWDEDLQQDLTQALALEGHLGKALYQLSTGSRRKVGLVATLASGATLTGLDQPYMALDMASVAVLQDFFRDAARHRSRAWLIADYEADAALPWASVIDLGG